jgi:superfamily II DNA or RNA helicase
MNFLLTEKIIKQLCGEIAYKKGDAYYRAQKVSVENYNANSPIIKASVKGDSIFHVTIQNDRNGNVHAECTCPSLASFNKYCQHIAAVLRFIQNLQQLESSPNRSYSNQQKDKLLIENRSINTTSPSEMLVEEYQLSNELLSLFGNKTELPSGNQLHFETRQILNVEFTCRPITLENGMCLFGVQTMVGRAKLNIVHKLRDFLDKIEQREHYVISSDFTYKPEIHSFQMKTDAVIRQLINIHQDEKVYLDSSNLPSFLNDSMILVPPTSWEVLFPLLSNAPFVKLEHDGCTYNGIRLSNDKIPLHFEFTEGENEGSRLIVKGLNQIKVLEAYGCVLYDGKIMKLPAGDVKRLLTFKQILDHSGKFQITIPPVQLEDFVETVMPGLMKLGNVRIAPAISHRLVKTPLKAKLFLDRVKNRLLAGLEFHYGNLVINPLEGNRHGSGPGPTVNREGEKEQQIMQIMEDSSFTKTEGGYFMHNEEEEYHFLFHVVPRFKKLVQIYATTAVKLRLQTVNKGPLIRVDVDKDERTDWLAFRFDIQGIPESEIRKLLESLEEKRKFYKMPHGSLLSLETKAFQKLNRFIDETGISGEELTGEGIRIPLIKGIQLIDTLQDGNVISMGQSFLKLMENLQNPGKQEFAVPASLNLVLRDYQKDGFRWLKTLAKYKFGGILADDMGLGKTLQSITFIVSVLPEIRERKLPALIVSPSSLLYNWLNELKKFAPEIKARIVDGSKLERSSIVKDISSVDVIITSYPLLRRDINMYAGQIFHTMIMDEAQAFKNYTTRTAKVVKMIQADYRFGLTGTPIENSLEELWSIFNVVFPSLFPGRKAFNELTRENVAKRVRPFLLRRLKEDVLKELPEKIESILSWELLPEQKKLYAAYLAKLKHDTLKHLNKDTFQKNRIRILAGLTRLRQLCCHPALFVEGYKGSSAKFEQLMEIVEECRSTGKRMLIFSQFTKMLDIIGRELGNQGVPYFYLDGNTPSFERVELCNRFNNGERDLFLISLKAGGTGLNLTGADTVVLYDLWWNPAVEQQAADRAYRMGQKNVVQVIKLVAHGTIEEKMNELQEKKKNLVEEIIQPSQEKLSALTEQEIKEILMIN